MSWSCASIIQLGTISYDEYGQLTVKNCTAELNLLSYVVGCIHEKISASQILAMASFTGLKSLKSYCFQSIYVHIKMIFQNLVQYNNIGL